MSGTNRTKRCGELTIIWPDGVREPRQETSFARFSGYILPRKSMEKARENETREMGRMG